jgi:hypothetical protein
LILGEEFKKMKKQNWFQLSLCLLLFAAPVFGEGGDEKTNDASEPSVKEGKVSEIIIKGGDKAGIVSEKPLLKLGIDADEAVLPVMNVETELLQRQPESLKDPRAGFEEYTINSRTIIPARIRLARDPVVIFYPLREIMAASPSLSQEIGTGWELVITDNNGRPFRKFAGDGLPPSSLPWNGRNQNGKILGVGKTYSPIVNYKDTRGQNRNFVGDTFTFDGVIHQETNGLIIGLAPTAIFDTRKGPSGKDELKDEVKDSGLELIREAVDWIKRYYFTYPIKVQAYGYDQKKALVQAQEVAKTVRQLLLLPREEIAADAYLVDTDVERIEILIVNR